MAQMNPNNINKLRGWAFFAMIIGAIVCIYSGDTIPFKGYYVERIPRSWYDDLNKRRMLDFINFGSYSNIVGPDFMATGNWFVFEEDMEEPKGLSLMEEPAYSSNFVWFPNIDRCGQLIPESLDCEIKFMMYAALEYAPWCENVADASDTNVYRIIYLQGEMCKVPVEDDDPDVTFFYRTWCQGCDSLYILSRVDSVNPFIRSSDLRTYTPNAGHIPERTK